MTASSEGQVTAEHVHSSLVGGSNPSERTSSGAPLSGDLLPPHWGAELRRKLSMGAKRHMSDVLSARLNLHRGHHVVLLPRFVDGLRQVARRNERSDRTKTEQRKSA